MLSFFEKSKRAWSSGTSVKGVRSTAVKEAVPALGVTQERC